MNECASEWLVFGFYVLLRHLTGPSAVARYAVSKIHNKQVISVSLNCDITRTNIDEQPASCNMPGSIRTWPVRVPVRDYLLPEPIESRLAVSSLLHLVRCSRPQMSVHPKSAGFYRTRCAPMESSLWVDAAIVTTLKTFQRFSSDELRKRKTLL